MYFLKFTYRNKKNDTATSWLVGGLDCLFSLLRFSHLYIFYMRSGISDDPHQIWVESTNQDLTW